MAVMASVVSGMLGAAVLLWQWVATLAASEATVAPAVLITAIVTLFGSLVTLVVWIGTKFLTKLDEGNKAAIAQTEASNNVAEALTKFTERFDGPIIHAAHHSLGLNQQTQTLGAPPSHYLPRKKGPPHQ